MLALVYSKHHCVKYEMNVENVAPLGHSWHRVQSGMNMEISGIVSGRWACKFPCSFHFLYYWCSVEYEMNMEMLDARVWDHAEVVNSRVNPRFHPSRVKSGISTEISNLWRCAVARGTKSRWSTARLTLAAIFHRRRLCYETSWAAPIWKYPRLGIQTEKCYKNTAALWVGN